MSADLEFHYKKALKKFKFTDENVQELREKIMKFENVPKNLSSKKVWKVWNPRWCFNENKSIFDSAFVLLECMQRNRWCRKRDINLLSNPSNKSCCILQSWSSFARNPTVLIKSILFPFAEHSIRSFCNVPLSDEPNCFKLHFRWSLQNIFHDDRCESENINRNFEPRPLNGVKIYTFSDSLLYSRGPSNGLIIVFDMRNVGMRHLLRPNIDSLKTFFRYLQEALPARLEAMHVINCVSFFDMVLALVKPFMKSEIIQKVVKRYTKELYNIYLINSSSFTDAPTSRYKLWRFS